VNIPNDHIQEKDESTMTTVNDNNNDSLINAAVVVCTASLVQKLTQARIPPNYIGTRRVAVIRPRSNGSHQILPAAEDGVATAPKRASVVFKVTNPDGTERRMTRQEKKALRQQVSQEKKRARLATKEEEEEEVEEQQQSKKKQKMEEVDDNSNEDEIDKTSDHEADDKVPESKNPSIASSTDNTGSSTPKYHQLSVNTTAMEQELAEFRGDRRDGLPPVMISPPMVLCASNILFPSSNNNETPQRQHSRNNWIQYDPALSKQWAQLLKASMLPAETVRQGEDMRPMAYQLTPEVWTRMRPEGNHLEEKLETKVDSSVYESTNKATTTMTSCDEAPANIDWLAATCRPPSPMDVAVAVVFDYLYQNTPLHVSCGAKFGSDFLVYDGPRSERHAFAGMRVLLPRKDENGPVLPLPSAYDMAGYVRCLNTAGKLALLATVIEESSSLEANTTEEESSSSSTPTLYRVAIVDVALEKILTAPTHQRHSRTEKRRDISRNLAKRK
jgi:hypothetical protein